MAILCVFVLLLGIIAPIILTQRKAEAWWSSSWTQRRKITLDNSASSTALSNFPVRVSLTSSNIDYAKTKAAGADIRFVDSDDTTLLPYQIEIWNNGGTSELWVRITTLAAGSSTDFIYMYYNNPAATDAQAPASVWSSNYRAAWHLNQAGNGTTGEFTDSSPNGNHGTGGGGASADTPTRVAGKIGFGESFDGSSDYVKIPYVSGSFGMTTSISISAWVKRGATNIYSPLFTKGDTNQASDYNMYFCDPVSKCPSSPNSLGFFSDGTSPGGVLTTAQVNDTSTWHYLTITRNTTSTAKLYIDGVLDSTQTMTGNFPNNAYDLFIGADDLGTGFGYFGGSIDELHVSNSTRTPDWIKAEYVSQNDAMNSFGSEETYNAGGGGGGGGGTADWWQICWNYRKKISFDTSSAPTNGTVSSIPIRVSLTTGNFNFSHALSTGFDIRFVDSNNSPTALDYDRDTWTAGSSGEFWVDVPSIQGQTTTGYIYMYYGCSTANTDTQNPTAVWDSNYVGIWHMREANNNTTNGYKDSTIYANHGTGADGGLITGAPNAVAAKIGNGQLFDGMDDYIFVSRVASLNLTSDITMQAWFKRSAIADYGNIFGKAESGAGDYQIYTCHLFAGCTPTVNAIGFNSDGLTSAVTLTNTQVTDTTNWHHILVSKTGTSLNMYLDGTLDKTATVTGSLSNANIALQMGVDNRGDGTAWFNGTSDELRLSNIGRNSLWAKIDYLSENNTLNTYGAEQTYPPDAPVLTALTNPASTTPTFQMRASDQVNPNYLRYKIDVCATSDCTSIVRTIDQTASQTGWSGQDSQTSTAYVASATLASSTLASHTYQVPALSGGTQYWWRAYAIDPGGSNSFSDPSSIGTFTTEGSPASPTLLQPIDTAIGVGVLPEFRLYTTDPNASDVRYKIQVCTVNDCSVILRTIDQNVSQTGWLSQNSGGATRYTTSLTLAGSQQAIHQYQIPALAPNTQYWWRAFAIDPTGSNTFGSSSPVFSFTAVGTGINGERITGGTTIKGGTKIGN